MLLMDLDAVDTLLLDLVGDDIARLEDVLEGQLAGKEAAAQRVDHADALLGILLPEAGEEALWLRRAGTVLLWAEDFFLKDHESLVDAVFEDVEALFVCPEEVPEGHHHALAMLGRVPDGAQGVPKVAAVAGVTGMRRFQRHTGAFLGHKL